MDDIKLRELLEASGNIAIYTIKDIGEEHEQ